MSRGLLFIVGGPSGAGKSSLGARVRQHHPELVLSVSCTTRAPRSSEIDGRDYHFVSRETFEACRERGEFAEWAEVHGNLYGTPRAEIDRAWARGHHVLFDIDYQGVAQLKGAYPDDTIAALIAPPDMDTLAARLRGRGTDSEEVVARRLDAARHELAQVALYDYVIRNEDFERSAQALELIYRASLLRASLTAGHVHALLVAPQAPQRAT